MMRQGNKNETKKGIDSRGQRDRARTHNMYYFDHNSQRDTQLTVASHVCTIRET